MFQVSGLGLMVDRVEGVYLNRERYITPHISQLT